MVGSWPLGGVKGWAKGVMQNEIRVIGGRWGGVRVGSVRIINRVAERI